MNALTAQEHIKEKEQELNPEKKTTQIIEQGKMETGINQGAGVWERFDVLPLQEIT